MVINLSQDVCMVIFAIVISYIGLRVGVFIGDKWILPKCANKGLKELERNPKWLAGKLKENYYGFHDVEFILAKSIKPICLVRQIAPRNNKLEVTVLDDEVTTKDVERIGKDVLLYKIQKRCGLYFADKPIHWLSILCYMLDGGDIQQEATRWEEKSVTKN